MVREKGLGRGQGEPGLLLLKTDKARWAGIFPSPIFEQERAHGHCFTSILRPSVPATSYYGFYSDLAFTVMAMDRRVTFGSVIHVLFVIFIFLFSACFF